MTSLLDGATDRGPLRTEGGRTQASFEQVVLADGTRAVCKRISRDSLLTRLTDGFDHQHLLWESGAFARMPDAFDHTTLGVEREGDDWLLVMRDIGDSIMADDHVLSRADNRAVLEAVDAMHREFEGERLPGTVDTAGHYRFTSPAAMASVAGRFDIAKLFVRGWALFGDVVPPRVAAAVRAIHEDPQPFADRLEALAPVTLAHGDLRLHNMGMGSKLALFDWEVAASAPAVIDFAWYLIISASRIAATREEVIADYLAIAPRTDPDALELSLLGALARLGWNKALDIIENPDPGIRAQERADLDWWIERATRALAVWSPV